MSSSKSSWSTEVEKKISHYHPIFQKIRDNRREIQQLLTSISVLPFIFLYHCYFFWYFVKPSVASFSITTGSLLK